MVAMILVSMLPLLLMALPWVVMPPVVVVELFSLPMPKDGIPAGAVDTGVAAAVVDVVGAGVENKPPPPPTSALPAAPPVRVVPVDGAAAAAGVPPKPKLNAISR
jgi:hypothetical protein